jgi:hypothetical protein
MNQKEQIKKWVDLLISKFTPGAKIDLIFREQAKPGTTTYEGINHYQITF